MCTNGPSKPYPVANTNVDTHDTYALNTKPVARAYNARTNSQPIINTFSYAILCANIVITDSDTVNITTVTDALLSANTLHLPTHQYTNFLNANFINANPQPIASTFSYAILCANIVISYNVTFHIAD